MSLFLEKILEKFFAFRKSPISLQRLNIVKSGQRYENLAR